MKVYAIFLCLSAVSVVCWAQPLLRYGPGTSDHVLTGCDDCNTGAQQVLYGDFEFMGQEQQFFAVHSNGYVTFPRTSSVQQYSFTPEVLSSLDGPPMIAPYWADADLRGSGKVFYRQSVCDEDRNNTAAIIRTKFGGNYRPTSMIVVTWELVGYYNQATDLLNTFQMVLASSRHGKTYLILMYSRLQWTTGSASGGSGGLGGTVAQAGYSSARLGVGSVSLPGSGTPAILHLSDWSNSQITGTFVFCVNDFICMDTQMYPQPTGFLQRVRASLGLLSKTFQKNAQKQQDNDDDMGDTGNSTSSSTLSIMIMEEHLNKY